jgi:DnaJ-domain-containing protein 1
LQHTGLPLARLPLKVARMNLNSRLFDRIRVKSAPQTAEPVVVPCNHPGCKAEGVFRAPMGRDREGQYFSFCMDHVREYNATYDYFRGMNDEALAKFQKDDIVGHRPTWPLGAKRGARPGPEHSDETIFGEARVYRRRGSGRSGKYKHEPRYNNLAIKALAALELDARADEAAIKTRYKELVKRHHPDANGGDRSSEEKLREIIQAYNYLRSNKLV